MPGNRKQDLNLAKTLVSFAKSQLILFHSRKKFAFLYCLATVSGLFCIPGVLAASSGADILTIARNTLPLPIASLLVTAGTYILNDLVDVDLDRANRKKRPIPSGTVSKKQGRIFVLLTFGTAVLLTMTTFSLISISILTLMLLIGIAYSAPKIALMRRFVIKTASIALFYILCALLGITSPYNIDLAIDRPAQVASILLTLALMVFISSTLNDMGDIVGDKASKRRTIPIVIGEENTIRLTLILAASVLGVIWTFYGASLAQVHEASLLSAFTTTAITLIVMTTLLRIRKRLQNAQFMRKQHKNLFPLQMALHPSLISGLAMI